MEIVGQLRVRSRKDIRVATEELRQRLYDALVNFDIFVEPLTGTDSDLGSEALAIADKVVGEVLKWKGYNK